MADLIKATADKRTIAALRGAFNAWLAKGQLGEELRVCVEEFDTGIGFSASITTVLDSSPERTVMQQDLPKKTGRAVGARCLQKCLEDIREPESPPVPHLEEDS